MAIFYNPNRKKGLFYIPSGATGGSVSAPLSIEYSANAFCEDGIDPTPTVSNNVGAGTFSSTTGLVFISTSTGEVDLSASTSGATYLITYTDTNSATATFSLTVNALDDASFAYSQSSYSPTDADPTPTITGVTGGTFSAGSGLVFVDSGSNTGSSTGEIDLSASTIASYTITYTTAGTCPNTSTQSVEIAAALAQVSNVYSMSFDATSSQYIDCGQITTLASASSFTISGWFNQTTLDQEQFMFGTRISSVTDNMISCYTWSDGNMYIDLRNGVNSYGYFDYSNVITAGQWFHLVMVFNGSGSANAERLKLYINGSLQTLSFNFDIPTITNATQGNFRIGGLEGFTQEWLGNIDEVGVFNTVLTAQEIQNIYNATETGKTADLNDLTTPPIKWYRMGD